jgi:segregation and condensation protein B
MLESQVESILFAAGKAMNLKQLAKICGRTKEEIEVVVEKIKAKFNNQQSGIYILENNNEVQMVINPHNANLVEALVKEEVVSELTKPQLETLTIIAYRGPISKLELEQIRGVNCGLILRNLIIKGLVEVKEDKIVENNTYKISTKFMQHLGITKIEELPEYDKLSKAEEIEEYLANYQT